jgi:hypothetical protein
MKISNIIFILILILSSFLVVLSFQSNPNENIIKTFSDILKGLVGALVGALAGEKYEK